MIDLHNHCLPGIDDGPADLAESLDLLHAFQAQGVNELVCTSHIGLQHLQSGAALRREMDRQSRQLANLREQAAAASIPITLHSGFELMLGQALLDRLQQGDLSTGLAGSFYLLGELPHGFSGDLAVFDAMFYTIRLLGFELILAHPERSLSDSRQIRRLIRRVRQEACWLQVNAGSLVRPDVALTETASPPAAERQHQRQRLARELLDSGVVSLIASDAHHARRRPPLNGKAFQWVESHYGASAARRLLIENPEAVLKDRLMELV